MAALGLQFLWFCILATTTKTQSLTTDRQSENPDVCTNQTSDQELNNLRQQLNQETTTTLSLTRHVYSLVGDMITIKKQMAKIEATKTSQSLTTNEKSKNPPTVVCTSQSSDQEMNNLRQQLSQETTIRLSLTRQMHSLVDDMITMKKQMEKMEAKVQEMETKEDDLQLANQRLQKELDQYLNMSKYTFDETSVQIGRIQEDLLNITSTMDAFYNETHTDKRAVVFNAAIKNTLNLQRNTPVDVVYDTVLYQTDNAYNPINGFFTAPSGGLYVFSWATVVAARKIFDAELLVNGQRKGVGNCNNEANPGYENCASTIPVALKSGDKVNIRTINANYAHGYNWSNFKGWKVW